MQITHNIPALRALNSLNKTNLSADKRMRNLSSGLRINSAADDAAGMAISNKMQTQVRGLKRAEMNSQDGISLVQTAEGALGEVQNMLQRMRELAVQGANGTLTADDRRAIQDEVDQLKEQITSTSELTEFNKLKLLNGQLDRRSFTDNEKVSNVAYVSDTVKPGEYALDVSKIGTQAKFDGIDASYKGGNTGRVSINGEEVEILATDTAEDAFQKIRDLCERVDITLTRDAGWGSEDGGKLHLSTKQAGRDQYIEIKTSSMELLNDLGLVVPKADISNLKEDEDGYKLMTKVNGTDAEATLVYKGSDPTKPDYGFARTSTVAAEGNRVIITDANYQKIYIDLSVNEAGTGLKNGTMSLTQSEMAKQMQIYGKSAQSLELNGFTFDFAKGSELNGYNIKFVNTDGDPVTATADAGTKTITINGDFTGTNTAAATISASGLQNIVNQALRNGIGATTDLVTITGKLQVPQKVEENAVVGVAQVSPIVANDIKFEFDDPSKLEGYTLEFVDQITSGAGTTASTASLDKNNKVIRIYKNAAGTWPTATDLKAAANINASGIAIGNNLNDVLHSLGVKVINTASGVTGAANPSMSTTITSSNLPPQFTIGDTSFRIVTDTTETDSTKLVSSDALKGYTIVFTAGSSDPKVGIDKNRKEIQVQGDNLTNSGAIALINNALKSAGMISGDAGIVALTASGGVMGAATAPKLSEPLHSKTEMDGGQIIGGKDVDPENSGILQNSENIEFTVLDAGPLQLQVGPNEGMKVEVQIPILTSTALGLEFVNMRTAEGASEAISLCDYAINEISAVRSKLGAYQNRLEYTINNLQTTSENTTAALSRIQDADMAEEMSEYTQKNVISQAGVNMLSQANQRPQQVLQLLQ